MLNCVRTVFWHSKDDPYVDHSGFQRSLSDTGSGPQHMFLHSYTEYYSAGLWAE